MQVQCVVGLCCLRRNPGAVDVTIGDMVMDGASEKTRDVDVTITMDEGDAVRAFKAYEVKREHAPLDVVAVEQLCAKLNDMSTVTHRGIVSASGYTAPAMKKAAAHGVELYEIRPWSRAIQEDFPKMPFTGSAAEHFRFAQSLLYWMPGCAIHLVAPAGPESFQFDWAAPVLEAAGRAHRQFPDMAAFRTEILQRSTSVLFAIEPARTVRNTFPLAIAGPDPIAVGPEWPHTHTLDVRRDEVYLSIQQASVQIEQVTISGFLRWECKVLAPAFYVVTNTRDGSVFAAAAVAVGPGEDQLMAIVFSPSSRTTNVHRVELTERQRNAIRSLKVRAPSPAVDGEA
jgi:hypothetical protein